MPAASTAKAPAAPGAKVAKRNVAEEVDVEEARPGIGGAGAAMAGRVRTAAAGAGDDGPATPKMHYGRASKPKGTDEIEKQDKYSCHSKDADVPKNLLESLDATADEQPGRALNGQQQPVVDASSAATAAAAAAAAAAACVPVHAVDDQQQQPAAGDVPAAVIQQPPSPELPWPLPNMSEHCKRRLSGTLRKALCEGTITMQQRYVSTSMPLVEAITLPTKRLSQLPRSSVSAGSEDRAAFRMAIGSLPFAAPDVVEVVEVVDGPNAKGAGRLLSWLYRCSSRVSGPSGEGAAKPLAPIFVLSKGRAGKPKSECELLHELNAKFEALEGNAVRPGIIRVIRSFLPRSRSA